MFIYKFISYIPYNDIYAYMIYFSQVFFYSTSIYKTAGIVDAQIQYFVLLTNAINVIMTIVAVSWGNENLSTKIDSLISPYNLLFVY